MEDYVNIVDLLGRAGRLDDAYDIVKGMPVPPDKGIWLCLLSACRIHGNVELAAKHLLSAEPAAGSTYVPLVNIYAEVELWDRAAHVRTSMRKEGLKKNLGRNWIEMKDIVEVFYSADSSSPRTEEIYDVLSGFRSTAKRRIAEEYMEEL